MPMTDALKLHIRALYAQGEALQNGEKPFTFEEYEEIAWNMGFSMRCKPLSAMMQTQQLPSH